MQYCIVSFPTKKTKTNTYLKHPLGRLAGQPSSVLPPCGALAHRRPTAWVWRIATRCIYRSLEAWMGDALFDGWRNGAEFVLKYIHVGFVKKTWGSPTITGWWLTYPSEKYESQLGLLFQIYGKKSCSKPPTRSLVDHQTLDWTGGMAPTIKFMLSEWGHSEVRT